MGIKNNKLIAELQERGFIYQYSEDLDKILNKKRTIYLGVDPTAESIHVGNLAVYIFALHLVKAGHKIILLIGGATAMIGDPSGKDKERDFLDAAQISKFSRSITKQVRQVIGIKDIRVVNNRDWLSKMSIVDFLRDIGKHFTVNNLVKKESISKRIQGDDGISFTEFSYSLLQGYDFYFLNKKMGVDLQIGGSDQWGNIVSGIELIRKKTGKTVYGLTTPLIVNKTTGKKFGKSEGNTVWLDPKKISPYSFYQFWFNTDDANVIDYLKIFTFLSIKEIDKLESKMKLSPGDRMAQKVLAYEVVKFVHSERDADNARKVSSILFETNKIENLTKEQGKMLFREAPTCVIYSKISITELLLKTKLASSKREARELIKNNAIKLNNKNVSIETELSSKGVYLLSRGKQKKCVINFVKKS
ncbi:MAG: tyrosine--tRNA ligase [Patescibacteria group bacterium]|nr:tyrosine--tRNA ligase [Patescibacteria group bacterium]